MGSFSWLLTVVVGLALAGLSRGAHLTKPVPLPEGVTIWDVCGMTVDHVKSNYEDCNRESEEYTKEHGTDIATQCKVIEMFNGCMIYHVALHCPDLYRQYYQQMGAFTATVIMFCGSTMGLISVEEFEHIAWEDFAMHYFEWLANSTEAPFIQGETTQAPQLDMTSQAAMTVNDTISKGNVTDNAVHNVNETVSDVKITENVNETSTDVNTNKNINETSPVANATGNITMGDNDVMAEGQDRDDDVSSGDADEPITRLIEKNVQAVTQRFIAATKAPATEPKPTKKMGLLDALTSPKPEV